MEIAKLLSFLLTVLSFLCRWLVGVHVSDIFFLLLKMKHLYIIYISSIAEVRSVVLLAEIQGNFYSCERLTIGADSFRHPALSVVLLVENP